MITPKSEITEILKHQSIFSVGSLIYSIPFSKLENEKVIKKQLSTMKNIQEMENNLIELKYESTLILFSTLANFATSLPIPFLNTTRNKS